MMSCFILENQEYSLVVFFNKWWFIFLIQDSSALDATIRIVCEYYIYITTNTDPRWFILGFILSIFMIVVVVRLYTNRYVILTVQVAGFFLYIYFFFWNLFAKLVLIFKIFKFHFFKYLICCCI